MLTNARKPEEAPATLLGIGYGGTRDTGAALIHHGKVVTAVEEERLSRDKGTRAFPRAAIAHCLEAAVTLASPIDFVAVSQEPRAILRRAWTAPRSIGRWSSAALIDDLSLLCDLATLRRRLPMPLRRVPIRHVRHHHAHVASAFFASPFGVAAVLSIDGIGEMESGFLGVGDGFRIIPLRRYEFPFSVGKFYGAVCRHLGFYGPAKEGTVMGLAPYGDPNRYGPAFRRLLAVDERTGDPEIDLTYFSFGWSTTTVSRTTPRFDVAFAPPRKPQEPLTRQHLDLAAGLQASLEAAVFSMLRYLGRRTGLTKLCFAGGVALNSVANGKIYAETPFKEVYIPPAPNDSGLALGAALWCLHHDCGVGRHPQPFTAYLGPSYRDAEIVDALGSAELVYETADVGQVANLLAEGYVVGWFQGKSELGPRALGARSILADPRSREVRQRLNAMVKEREWFRPFAPVVLEEECDRFFQLSHPSPFMQEVHPARPEAMAAMPAVVHIDGTARVQTVNARENATLVELLYAFRAITGVGVLLNTSFNHSDEPIVQSPRDAVATYLRTGLDALYIGPFLVRRPVGGPAYAMAGRSSSDATPSCSTARGTSAAVAHDS